MESKKSGRSNERTKAKDQRKEWIECQMCGADCSKCNKYGEMPELAEGARLEVVRG